MKSVSLLIVVAKGSLVLGALSAGCLDLTPVDFDTPTADAGAEGGAEPGTPCERCLMGGEGQPAECGEEVAACREHDTCRPFLGCILSSGCFELEGEQRVTQCGVPCALNLGIGSVDDPSMLLFIDIVDCSLEACSDVCFGGSAAAAP